MSDFGDWTPEKQQALMQRRAMHYHGETVRRLFLAAGVLMLFTMAFVRGDLPAPYVVTLFGVVLLSLIAGVIDPFRRWTAYVDVIASAIGLIAFGYQIRLQEAYSGLFWINLALSVVFMFALYFAVKTLRGRFLHKKFPEDVHPPQ